MILFATLYMAVGLYATWKWTGFMGIRDDASVGAILLCVVLWPFLVIELFVEDAMWG